MPKTGGGTAGGSRSKISYVRPQEPSFLKKLKDQVGYKGPQSTLQNKFDELDKEDLSDGEDEQPTIVVLKEGDLSAEEAKVIQTDLELKAEDEPPSDGKIVFKRPLKRVSDSKVQKVEPKKKEAKKSLLSFDDREDDEDE